MGDQTCTLLVLYQIRCCGCMASDLGKRPSFFCTSYHLGFPLWQLEAGWLLWGLFLDLCLRSNFYAEARDATSSGSCMPFSTLFPSCAWYLQKQFLSSTSVSRLPHLDGLTILHTWPFIFVCQTLGVSRLAHCVILNSLVFFLQTSRNRGFRTTFNFKQFTFAKSLNISSIMHIFFLVSLLKKIALCTFLCFSILHRETYPQFTAGYFFFSTDLRSALTFRTLRFLGWVHFDNKLK